MNELMVPLFFFGLDQVWRDFNLILKIFVIMTIYSWVKNHVQNNAIGMIIFFAVTFFVVFDMWTLFGGIYIFWMLLMFGISQIVIDFFFISPAGGGQMESPVSSGKDLAMRQRQGAKGSQNFAQGFMRRGK